MSQKLCIQKQYGKTTITIEAIQMGDDLCVCIYGGDRPHIGAVAVAQARPSLKSDGTSSATTSVIALLGHKEDEIAKQAADTLARLFGVTVSVSCGIHIDNLAENELRTVIDGIHTTLTAFIMQRQGEMS